MRGKPYWAARLSFASSSLPLRPENAGFTVSRRWKTKGPWALGQVVEVEVTLVTPSTRRHVLLFDPFPAGLEPLHTTRADLAEAEQGHQSPWEWREAVTDGMLLYAGAMPPGVYRYTYALRAITPGVFVQRPGTVEETYAPEVYGRTGPDTVTVER